MSESSPIIWEYKYTFHRGSYVHHYEENGTEEYCTAQIKKVAQKPGRKLVCVQRRPYVVVPPWEDVEVDSFS